VTLWQRFRPNLIFAACVIGFAWWSSTLPSQYTAAEFMRSFRLLLIFLGIYLAIAGAFCVISQANYEARVRNKLRARGYAVNDEMTISGILKWGMILVAVIYGALHFRSHDSKITGPASQSSAEPR